MVRRAKLPRDGSNQIDRRYVPYGNRALAGWPDGIRYEPRIKKRRKKPVRESEALAAIEAVEYSPKPVLIGTPE